MCIIPMYRSFWAGLLIAAVGVFSAPSIASPQASIGERLKQATELLDSYYGNRTSLETAGSLIEQIIQEDPKNANAYMQAARLIGKDGWFASDSDEPIVFEKYRVLLDKAIALDPKLPEAYILKAQYFGYMKNYPEQLRALDKAKSLGTDNRWMWIGYGDYYRNTRAYVAMMEHYTKVEAMGPGGNGSQRRAFIYVLKQIGTSYRSEQDTPIRLKKYAELARKERDPADAWTLQFFAQEFLELGMFDDAIVFARESLSTMDFGSGRLTLVTALFGKAAQLQQVEMRPTKFLTPYLVEANSFGFSIEAIVERFANASPNVKNLVPIFAPWVSPIDPTRLKKL